MNRPKATSIAIDAFYDNFTCGALFRKLRIPGSPKEIIDPRPVQAFWADEFQQILEEVQVKLQVIFGAAMVGVLVSALQGAFKRQTAKREDPESFLADWSSYIKS